MVSQKFMEILYQQPQYSSPSTSNCSSSISRDVQEPSISSDVQEPNISRDVQEPSIRSDVQEPSRSSNVQEPNRSSNVQEPNRSSDVQEPLEIKQEIEEVIVKQEVEDMIIKEEQDDVDDLLPPIPQAKKSDTNLVMLPFNEAPRAGNTSIFTSENISPPHLTEDTEGVRPPSKRVRKEKIIFDPSDTSDPKTRKKISGKFEDNISNESETNKYFREILEENKWSEYDEQWTGNLKCKYCGKCVQRFDYLRLHLMKHTGEAPHKCPLCDNAYRYRWRLTQHIRTHTKDLPYHCPLCNYRGNRSDYLTSHLRRKHKKTDI